MLTGLKDQLLHRELMAEFVLAYQAEFNRLTAEMPKSKAKTKHELAKIIKLIGKMADAIAEAMFHPSFEGEDGRS